jgi:hypothetical protein
MDWCSWVDIPKGIDFFVLVHLLGWNFAFGDLTKQAIRIVVHPLAPIFGYLFSAGRFAGSLFFNARSSEAPSELSQYLFWTQTKLGQGNQAVKPKICHLTNEEFLLFRS